MKESIHDSPLTTHDSRLTPLLLLGPLFAAEQARRLGQRLPLAETYTSLMQGCVAHGDGALDNSAVIREIRRRTG